MSQTSFDAEFDVVVVGAGSAGCVLSARLTENPKVSLCVIEAGGRDRNPWIHVPMGFGKLVPNPKVNWGYETEPEPGLGGRKIIWPRGKVLGGSGSINGLVFLRGAPSDYDGWQRLGAQGWSYADVLPYFTRMEHCVEGANEWHGTGGPMTVSNIKRPSTAARAFVETCERLQYPRNSDFNGQRIDGVGFAPLNVHNGWRRSTAVGYLKPKLEQKKSRANDEGPCSPHPVR
jgi:choline dehydrogenase-like flavoprotein